MSEPYAWWKISLKNYHNELRTGIIIANVLPALRPLLTDAEYIRVDEKECRIDSIDELVRILLTKDQSTFFGFCSALEDNGYPHWAIKLRVNEMKTNEASDVANSAPQKKKTIKCMVVGDCAAEKTALLSSYTSAYDNSSVKRSPIVFENYPVTVLTGGQWHTLELFDVSGAEDYDHLRTLNYPGTDVFLVCYSVVSPESFRNVKKMWVPEITYQCPNTPFLLVGTQSEMRDHPVVMAELARERQWPISFDEGRDLAAEVKATKFVECSAETRKGVKNVFEEAILTALEPPPGRRQKKKCCSLY